MADKETNVAKCSGDQTANKEDTASNEITIDQYLRKYKSQIIMHAHARYKNEAQDIVQRITEDDLEHLNAQEPGDIDYTLTAQQDNYMEYLLNDNVGADPVETSSLTERGSDIVHLLEQSDEDQSNGPGNSGSET